MEFNGNSRFRHLKSPSTDRFLGVYPYAPPPDNPSSASTVGEELNEDDIFLSDNFDCSNSPGFGDLHNPLQRATSLSSSPLNHKSFSLSENFGILAVIRDASRPNSHFFRKMSISSASSSSATSAASSSSRLIPSIPKPPQERVPIVSASSSSSCLGIYHQSAPVNVPILAKAMRKNIEFDGNFDSGVEEEGEMFPPHEIVAKSLAQSPMLACSVLEGVGRTLKGRDLRKVRNAVWRQTGFLD